jgi:hypothetical protein
MRNQKPCHQGWSLESGNKDGDCCCNCKWQRPVMKHPTNKKHMIWTGSIMHQLAWICALPEPSAYPHVYFMDHEHGMCELHTPRDYSKYTPEHTFEALSQP